MSALAAALRLDGRLQARSRLYAFGLIVAVALGALGRLLPADGVGRGLVAFYVLGLGGTTFLFGAATLLLERSERTLFALRVTPLAPSTWLASKVLTLAAFALLESAVVLALAGRGVEVRPAPFIAGIGLGAGLQTWIALGLAARFESVTAFLLPTGALVASLLQLPFLALFDVGPGWLWWLLPTRAPMTLLLAAFEPVSTGAQAAALTASLGWAAAAAGFAAGRLRRDLDWGR